MSAGTAPEAITEAGRVPEVGVAMIRAERLRQVAVEGYTPEHDARHRPDELAMAGAAYALDSAGCPLAAVDAWPFTSASFKPGPKPLDSLVKAGALIAAEIDRIVATEAEAAK